MDILNYQLLESDSDESSQFLYVSSKFSGTDQLKFCYNNEPQIQKTPKDLQQRSCNPTSCSQQSKSKKRNLQASTEIQPRKRLKYSSRGLSPV